MKLTLEDLQWNYPDLDFITIIGTTGKEGKTYSFALALIAFTEKNEHAIYAYPTCEIVQEGFEMRFRLLGQNVYQVIYMYNQEDPALSGKGLPEAIIRWWSKYKKCSVVSSSNNPDYWTCETGDQRSPGATKVWQRIYNAEYIEERDQFILSPASPI